MYEYKFAEFCRYCPKCRYLDVPEDQSPCTDCLEQAVRAYSHKPAYFAEAVTAENARTDDKHKL